MRTTTSLILEKRRFAMKIAAGLVVAILTVYFVVHLPKGTKYSAIGMVDTVKYAHEKKSVADNSLTRLISPDHPSPHDNIWIDLQDKLTVIRRTVFFDARKDFGPQIVIISLHHDSVKVEQMKMFAHVVKSDNQSSQPLCLEVKKWRQVGWVREKIKPPETYVTYLLRISHPTLTTVPKYISLSYDRNCEKSTLLPKMPVFFDKRPRDNIFAVCTQKGLFGHVTPNGIIDWIEMNRALGAAIITIQIQYDQLGDQIKEVLVPYIKSGFVELIDWKITVTTRDYGMSASANECIYRNINRAMFVTIQDTDELLVPQKHSTWPELIAHLKTIINIEEYASFSFRNTHWYDSGDPLLTESPCPGRDIPRYFNWTLRTSSPTYASPKVMANLDSTIAAFCHCIWRWKYGVRKEFPISPALGLSHHYRIPSKGQGGLKSDVMKRYVSKVMSSIKSTVCPSS